MRSQTRISMRPILVALATVVFMAGCGGNDATGPQPSPQPQPGQLRVTVVPTAGSTGVVVLHVTGPSITSPTAGGGASLYHDLSGGTLRAAVVGTSLSGEVLRFSVPDVQGVSDYGVTVEQAAGNDNEPLAASGIAAEVTQVP